MKWRLLSTFNLKCGGVMARSGLIKSCLVQSLELWSSLSSPFAWECGKVEFDSPVLQSAFYLQEKNLNVFFFRIQDLCHGRIGLMELSSFHTFPMVTSSRGNSSRQLGPLGGKGAGDTTDPRWGIDERGSARIERSQESTACSQLWTLPFLPQNWSF